MQNVIMSSGIEESTERKQIRVKSRVVESLRLENGVGEPTERGGQRKHSSWLQHIVGHTLETCSLRTCMVSPRLKDAAS